MTVKAMTAEQLTKKIVNKEPLFLLDVRNQADVQDWKIEGEAIVHMNVPYFDLLEGVEGILHDIPHDREVLVVCAKEGSSYHGRGDAVRGGQNGPLFRRRHEGVE